MSETLLIRGARALYQQWCEEVEIEGIEMAPWDKLGDKDTWIERSRAFFKAIAGDPGHHVTDRIIPIGESRAAAVWAWDKLCIAASEEGR